MHAWEYFRSSHKLRLDGLWQLLNVWLSCAEMSMYLVINSSVWAACSILAYLINVWLQHFEVFWCFLAAAAHSCVLSALTWTLHSEIGAVPACSEMPFQKRTLEHKEIQVNMRCAQMWLEVGRHTKCVHMKIFGTKLVNSRRTMIIQLRPIRRYWHLALEVSGQVWLELSRHTNRCDLRCPPIPYKSQHQDSGLHCGISQRPIERRWRTASGIRVSIHFLRGHNSRSSIQRHYVRRCGLR